MVTLDFTEGQAFWSTVERTLQVLWFVGCLVLGYPFWLASISLLYETLFRIVLWYVYVMYYILNKDSVQFKEG